MDSAPSTVTAGSGERRHRRLATRQTKLMLMLLLTSIISVAVVGFVEFQYGAQQLQQAVIHRLVQARDSQSRAVEGLFSDMTNSLAVFSGGLSAAAALKEFTSAFDQLATAAITPEQQHALVDYYQHDFTKALSERTGEEADVEAFVPTSNAQRYLQAHYTVTGAHAVPADGSESPSAPQSPESPGTLHTPEPGPVSAWSTANARFDQMFSKIIQLNGFTDALLLDDKGNVVYSVNKGVDLGTNVFAGPFRESKLRDAYRKALSSNAVNFVWMTDYELYQPHLQAPTAWLVSPIGTPGAAGGVLAMALSSAKITRIMTGDRGWEAAEMGRTTETYLAGPDDLMRSDSRLFLQDPQQYRREAMAAGTSEATVDEVSRLGTTVLVQPVSSPGLHAAQGGQTGALTTVHDYLGKRELTAYAPLTVPNSDLQWSILATREYADAFSGITSFSRRVVLATTAVIFAICVMAILLARFLLEPIRTLQVAAQRISAGDYTAVVPARTADEIGDLTKAFNDMSQSLRTKDELLRQQCKQNNDLMLSLMPESLVRRYRDGERAIAVEHRNVSVIYTEIQGIDQLSEQVSASELVGIIDELFRQFDAAADDVGVERIRTMYNGYLAGCGLTTPRLDAVNRAVEFARSMQRIVDRFAVKSSYRLSLWTGISTGEVVSGLVGRSGVTYDLWGPAVNLAYELRTLGSEAGIYVTANVRDKLGELSGSSLAGAVTVGDLQEQAWRLPDPQ